MPIEVDEAEWRGLKFEASLLSGVFGKKFTPEGVLAAKLYRPKSRKAGAGS